MKSKVKANEVTYKQHNTDPNIGTILKAKKGSSKTSPPLLFIDTNILLDFYRARNDAGISLLSKIDALHNQTITTCQVNGVQKKSSESNQ